MLDDEVSPTLCEVVFASLTNQWLQDDSSEHQILEKFRTQRLEALKQQYQRNRFGDVRGTPFSSPSLLALTGCSVEIAKDEWVREVTESSNSCWVVVFLYMDAKVECRLLEEKLVQVAAKFRDVKFLKIRSTQAIENWPERNLPTLFVYRDGTLQHQVMTLKALGGTAMTADGMHPAACVYCKCDVMDGICRFGVVASEEGDSGVGAGGGSCESASREEVRYLSALRKPPRG